jgi:hypothetical protein
MGAAAAPVGPHSQRPHAPPVICGRRPVRFGLSSCVPQLPGPPVSCGRSTPSPQPALPAGAAPG